MTDLFDNFTVALNLTGGTSSVEQYFTLVYQLLLFYYDHDPHSKR